MDQDTGDDRHFLQLLESGESLRVATTTTSAKLVVTDRRVVVAADDRVALDIAFKALRRVQFDIERDRPATLVIVPESPTDEPQVLAVPPERYDEVTLALAVIGRELAEAG